MSGVSEGMQKREALTIEASKVILSGVKFGCTACWKDKPWREFGLRRMPDGTVRNQAQCTKCRGGH